MSREATDVRPQPTAASSGTSAPPAVLAGWWRRVGAYLVDVLVFAVLVLGAGLLGAAMFGYEDANGELTGGVTLLVILAYVGYIFFYAPLLLRRAGARNGQTLGKQVLGIRVVRENGEPMTFGTGFIREILVKQILGALTGGIFTLVSCLWPLWDRRNQAVHDKMCSTLVVRAEA